MVGGEPFMVLTVRREAARGRLCVVAQVSPGPSTGLAEVPLLGRFRCLLSDPFLPSPPTGGQ